MFLYFQGVKSYLKEFLWRPPLLYMNDKQIKSNYIKVHELHSKPILLCDLN